MDDPAILTLVGVGIAVVVIAVYLIIIAMILKRVTGRLVLILDAVGQSTRRSEPVGAVMDDINRDLEQGRAAIEACVARLEQRFGAANGGAEVEAQGIQMGLRRAVVRTGYSAASAAADETVTRRANLRRGNVVEPAETGGDLGLMPDEHASGPEGRRPTATSAETTDAGGGATMPPEEQAERTGSEMPGERVTETDREPGGRRWWNR